MPDWLAPFHLPKYTTEEFKQLKAEYVAKYGYTLTVPSLEQILIIGAVQPPNALEEEKWKKKEWSFFGEERLEELKEYKAKRKAQFLAMLGSPTPTMWTDIGAFLTALDDLEDALSTLLVAGRILAWMIPGILGRALLGPLGWLLTGAELVNLIMNYGRQATLPGLNKISIPGTVKGWARGAKAPDKTTKAAMAAVTVSNARTRKVAVPSPTKLNRVVPTVGNAIEVAQVTGQVFGYGISLGPVVGFISDLMWTAARSVGNQAAMYYKLLLGTSPLFYAAAKVPKAVTLLLASGYELDEETMRKIAVTNYLSQVEIFSNNEGWNPLSNVKNIENTEIMAPQPKNPITLEVLNESGYDWQKTCVWPHNGKQWAKTTEIATEYARPCGDWINNAIEKHSHDATGLLLTSTFTEAHLYAMANLEGEDKVKCDLTEGAKWAMQMADLGLYPDPDQPREKLTLLGDFLEQNEKEGKHLGQREYFEFMGEAGIKLIQTMGAPP